MDCDDAAFRNACDLLRSRGIDPIRDLARPPIMATAAAVANHNNGTDNTDVLSSLITATANSAATDRAALKSAIDRTGDALAGRIGEMLQSQDRDAAKTAADAVAAATASSVRGRFDDLLERIVVLTEKTEAARAAAVSVDTRLFAASKHSQTKGDLAEARLFQDLVELAPV
jgi:hypothetical protein